MYLKKINITFVLFVLFISNANALFSQKKDHYLVAIAFYNLENLFDIYDDPKKFDEDFTPKGTYKYTEEIYKKKLQNLSRVLSEIATDKIPEGPSIIGISEIENDKVVKDLLQTPLLKYRGWRCIVIEGPDVRGVDVGLIYNPRHFQVIEAKSHLVLLEENGKRIHTRDILQVTGTLMNDTITVLVGHWPSRRGGEAASQWRRVAAAQVCRDIKDSIVKINPHARVIVMGDLNDDPVSYSVVNTLGAKGEKKKVETGEFYNPFWAYYKKGLGTLGYNDSWNLFDQIIITSGFLNKQKDTGWTFLEANIFKRNYLINQFGQYKGYPHRSFVGTKWVDGYSDHFPTYIYIVKEK